MKATGIVVEYNPLHFGHVHHIEETKRQSGADVLIAVMSTHAVQRGEFSVVDKFEKTHWALSAGIDLVVELPGVMSLQNADRFAYASVAILEKLRCEELVFGSESADADKLRFFAEIMRTDAFDGALKDRLEMGESYPTSAHNALQSLTGDDANAGPNDILGIQYIDALYKLQSRMVPRAIKRIDSGYYEAFDDARKIQSATALRKRLKEGESIAKYVPSYVQATFERKRPVFMDDFMPMIRYTLAKHDPKTLQRIFGFDEGLENLFLNAADTPSFDALVKSLISKRYTHAKIKRAIMHALLHVEKNDIMTFDPPYLRVLGMNEKGQNYLNAIKKDLDVPLITKIKRERHRYLDLELRFTKIYDLVADASLYKQEFAPLRKN